MSYLYLVVVINIHGLIRSFSHSQTTGRNRIVFESIKSTTIPVIPVHKSQEVEIREPERSKVFTYSITFLNFMSYVHFVF